MKYSLFPYFNSVKEKGKWRPKSTKKRWHSLDLLRGFAVLLMIFYHFFYDYGFFGYWQINMNEHGGWRFFRYIIVSLFLVVVGISLSIQHKNGTSRKAIIKRFVLVGGASLIISVVSFVLFPDVWIYFGILHFILIASLLALGFHRLPNVSLIVAVLIIVGSAQGYISTYEWFQLSQSILELPKRTLDLVPLFPWFGVVLIGLYMGHYALHDLSASDVEKRLENSSHRVINSLTFMGRHALLIYLIHQPILFAGFKSFQFFASWV